jgi:rhamnosyl/mannosyltransferase
MKILQVNKFYYPAIGGIETFVKDIGENLTEATDWQVDALVCHRQRGEPNSTEKINGVTIHRARSWGTLLSMPISFQLLWRFRQLAPHYDVILLHHPFPLGFFAYRLFGRNRPMVVWYFSDIVRQRFSGRLIAPLIRSVLRAARGIIVYSQSFIKNSPVVRPFADKVTIIPYGIDTARFKHTAEINNEVQSIRNQYITPIILTVGRLVSYKGFEHLIEAAAPLSATVLIVGTGPLQTKLNNQIISLGASKRIHILSPLPDLRPVYQAADFFVLPSVTEAETLGIVQLEAMAAGKPVINTNLPTAVPEAGVHEETGLTVPPGDTGALSEAIKNLLSNADLRQKYGDAAQRRVQEKFDKSIFTHELVDFLVKINRVSH